MGDSPDAAARAAISDEAEAALQARAAAALAGSGSTSGAPAVGVPLTSADLAKWAGQVEAEFTRVKARFDDKIAVVSEAVSSAREVTTACADRFANLDVILRQFIENNSGRTAASRDDGDAREGQRQKAQLTDDMATWKNVNTARKLWIIGERIPPNLWDSPADLQSFVGEAIHVTANMASQLRYFNSFEFGAYGSRVGGPIGHPLTVTDLLDLVRLAVISILSVDSRPGSPTKPHVWRG